MERLSVTIVGAGIGGLSCAIALREAGHDVHVFERAPTLLPIGAGICMWPNGARALRALGVTDAFEGVSPILNRVSYRDLQGDELRVLSLSDMTERVGQRSYPLARADLHEALLWKLGRDVVTLDHECAGATQDADGAEVEFLNGRRVRSDLLVAADGVRSVLRPQVVPEPPPLIPYYNSSVGLVPASLGLTPQDTFTFYVGENKRVGLLDVGRQRTYYFIDSPLNPEPFAEGTDHREVLRARFTGWCESVQTLIDHADPAVPPQVICDYETLPTYVNGRIVLLGDAAHATTPTLGQGAAMALEDSLVLARQLRSHERLHEALAAYVEERRPRASDVVHLARARTLAMLGVEPDSAAAWYARLKDASVQDFIDQQVEIAATAPALSI